MIGTHLAAFLCGFVSAWLLAGRVYTRPSSRIEIPRRSRSERLGLDNSKPNARAEPKP